RYSITPSKGESEKLIGIGVLSALTRAFSSSVILTANRFADLSFQSLGNSTTPAGGVAEASTSWWAPTRRRSRSFMIRLVSATWSAVELVRLAEPAAGLFG